MFNRIKHLLSAELDYRRHQLWWWYGFLIIALFFIGFRDHRPRASYQFGMTLQDEYTLLLWLMIAIHAYLTYRLITSSKIELRSYFYLPLPVTRSDIAWVRLCYILLIHGATFVIMAGFILLILEPTQMEFSRYVTSHSWEVKEMFFGTMIFMCFGSLFVSITVLLLETRRQRPLLSTAQWLIFATLVVLATIPLFGGRILFLSNRIAFSIVRSRPDTMYLMLPLIPVAGLAAVVLGVMYYRRVTGMTSWQE
jgi:hypothetical protein